MKWLYAFVAIFLTVSAQEDYCVSNMIQSCNGIEDRSAELDNCNATFSGFQSGIEHLQAYANEQILKSYDYLLLASNFGTYVKNRPGFAKQFKGLSDSAFNRGIDLIKHMTKRGGEHNFFKTRRSQATTPQRRVLELNEISGMAFALDNEKQLALEAHALHERYSHANHKSHYDAEIAHYLEEEFIEAQASTVRKLSGYITDLRKLLSGSEEPSLLLYMYDEYLQKQ